MSQLIKAHGEHTLLYVFDSVDDFVTALRTAEFRPRTRAQIVRDLGWQGVNLENCGVISAFVSNKKRAHCEPQVTGVRKDGGIEWRLKKVSPGKDITAAAYKLVNRSDIQPNMYARRPTVVVDRPSSHRASRGASHHGHRTPPHKPPHRALRAG